MRNGRGSSLRLVAALLAFLALAIAAAGAVVVVVGSEGAIGLHPQPTPTQVPREPPPTPASTSYVYFYSRVEYPLELRLNATPDTVTLQLSFEKNILFVTPTAGSGTAPISNLPFSLPTDLHPYQDISAEADATAGGRDSPVIWQLVSPPRQSLLRPPTPGVPLDYVSSVTFRWRVSAVRAGPNLVTLSLAISYTLLNGTEEQGQIEVSPDPIPILAVEPPPVTLLPSLRIEIGGFLSLVGLVSIAGFFWNTFSVVDTVVSKIRALRDLLRRRRDRRRRVPPAAPSPARGPTTDTTSRQ
jgi:hypothetical protein